MASAVTIRVRCCRAGFVLNVGKEPGQDTADEKVNDTVTSNPLGVAHHGCSDAIAFDKVRVEIHIVHSYIALLSGSVRARLNPVFQVIQKLSIGTSHRLFAIGVIQPNAKNPSDRLR